jgi:hypothetical protein
MACALFVDRLLFFLLLVVTGAKVIGLVQSASTGCSTGCSTVCFSSGSSVCSSYGSSSGSSRASAGGWAFGVAANVRRCWFWFSAAWSCSFSNATCCLRQSFSSKLASSLGRFRLGVAFLGDCTRVARGCILGAAGVWFSLRDRQSLAAFHSKAWQCTTPPIDAHPVFPHTLSSFSFLCCLVFRHGYCSSPPLINAPSSPQPGHCSLLATIKYTFRASSLVIPATLFPQQKTSVSDMIASMSAWSASESQSGLCGIVMSLFEFLPSLVN